MKYLIIFCRTFIFLLAALNFISLITYDNKTFWQTLPKQILVWVLIAGANYLTNLAEKCED